jgi:hypothetical protein
MERYLIACDFKLRCMVESPVRLMQAPLAAAAATSTADRDVSSTHCLAWKRAGARTHRPRPALHFPALHTFTLPDCPDLDLYSYEVPTPNTSRAPMLPCASLSFATVRF